MYGIPVVATLAFVVAASFTPGPNNVMSATLALMHGFRRTVPFLIGIAAGFATVLLVCAVAAAVLLRAIPALEPILRWIGAGYIVWLAWTTWASRDKLGAHDAEEIPASHGFVGGFVLQFVNVKGLVYGVMMYTTFLVGLTAHPVALVVSAVALGAVAFVATATWALAGIAIRGWLRNPSEQAIVAGVLALTLVYTAVELVVPAVGR